MEAIAAKTRNPVIWFLRYLREAKEELEKVAWPSRADVVRYSALVIVVGVALAAAFAALDWALSLGLEQLIRLSK
ncbi:preprotein translocase subunit SecE [Candidatus Uhrbacteria bacterium RIFCSPHIGHO2_01_FULL_63_20]|uniref:Preprotein translocase subunit SecE n=1 Tax=Candidatus Uhrbacteria bacterium RIFCSPHIGHO2_01_FULL_63_20 TaxID=1802385 RepID=A0A1F7TME8_9BACT|nr:MAG: preprotein translocase subunit SecE [Candidatus Uhrbacteria bacterium RIFCSPHIGHO2_01_FULL_63_20]